MRDGGQRKRAGPRGRRALSVTGRALATHQCVGIERRGRPLARAHEVGVVTMGLPETYANRRAKGRTLALAVAVWGMLLPATARATWSIVIVDTDTKEMAVGCATCLTSEDLKQWVPLVLVDVGTACAQSAGDGGATNRNRILDQFLVGTPPDEIIDILSVLDAEHHTRQYGLVDVLGRSATFTGWWAGAHASGVTGRVGSLVYSIQGNVLTGAPVVLDAEQAVIDTPGDLAEKLMASMEAARAMGGDGRCSCSVLGPPACGAPPHGGNFTKSAHVAFMIATRSGDTDGVCTAQLGCATGDYFMKLNVAWQHADDPDPVEQLQAMFETWRSDLVGQPDARQSTGAFDRPWLRADTQDVVRLRVTARDWQGSSITSGPLFAEIMHAPTSDGRALIFTAQDLGGGAFEVEIGLAAAAGRDKFRVVLTGSGRPAVVLPIPELLVVSLEDMDADGEVDLVDQAIWTACLSGPVGGIGAGCEDADIDRDGHVDLGDFARLQRAYTNERCESLEITEQPQRADLCVGDPLLLAVGVNGDPAPRYQWYHYGVAIPDATGPSYGVAATTEVDHGYYEVEVTNTCGAVMSNPTPIRIVTEPCP